MQTVIILDFGSQYTQLIARRIREKNVYCEVRSCLSPCDVVPDALVLSGGPSSVFGGDAPKIDERWLSLDVPILGICYGMQLLAHHFGGRVRSSAHREYGSATLLLNNKKTDLFSEFPLDSEVWMSHGDDVEAIPDGWEVCARTRDGVIAAISEHKIVDKKPNNLLCDV